MIVVAIDRRLAPSTFSWALLPGAGTSRMTSAWHLVSTEIDFVRADESGEPLH